MPAAELTRLLATGEIELKGRMPWSSNGTFLVRVGEEQLAIYKPERGERPLWDFPPGLWRREIAAYIAEGSLTPDQGERLMRAGQNKTEA